MPGKAKTFIRVDLSDKEAIAKLRKLQKEFEAAGGKIKTSFGDKLAKFGLQSTGILNAIAGARKLADTMLDVSQQVDFAAKSSRQLGLQSTADFIALRHGADQAGVGMEQLRMGLVMLNKQGLELGEVADEIANIEDPTARMQRAMELLGTEAGPRVLTLLENGSAGLQRMREEADLLGLTVSDNTAAKFEELNDTLDRVRKAGTGAARQLAASMVDTLIPLIKKAAIFAEDIGLRLRVVWEFASLAFNGIALGFSKMWNGMLRAAEASINAFVDIIWRGAEALPAGFRDMLGVGGKPPRMDFSGFELDTSIIESEMEAAGRRLLAAAGKQPIMAMVFGQSAVEAGAGGNGVKTKAEREKEAKERAKAMAKAQLEGMRKGFGSAIDEYRDKLAEEARELALLVSFDDAARDEEDRRRDLGFAGRLREDFDRVFQVIDEQKQPMRSALSGVASMGVEAFANMGQAIGSAFEAAFSGGDFGAALQMVIGQQLVMMGTSLVNAGVFTLAMAALAAIPVIGEAFGGFKAAGMALALAPVAIATGSGLIAAGSAMSAGGAEIQSRAQARSNRANPARGAGGGAPFVRSESSVPGSVASAGGGDQVININFDRAVVDKRRVARDVKDALAGA